MDGNMKLHWSPRSPYVRTVMVAAYERGLADRIETVRTVVGGTIVHRELMAENPLGKIPTLMLPDGAILFDSRVICEYLDTVAQGTRLFPAWPERATALRRLALGIGMLDVALLWLGERRRPEERRSEAHIVLWRTKIIACLDALERESDALGRDAFSIGHVGVGVALSYLDFRFAELGWRWGRTGLADWQAGFDARPSARANPWMDDS